MVRAHLKQTVSFRNPQICFVKCFSHTLTITGPLWLGQPPLLRFPSARRQEEGDGEEESGNWIMALQDQRV